MVTGVRRVDPGQDPDPGRVDSVAQVPAISPTPGPDTTRTPAVPARDPTRRSPRRCRRRGTRGIRRTGARTLLSRRAVARSRRSRARPDHC
ncbi:hypothetical protein GCM10015535_64600 [Streptomyces gelaticus]|uniref:Uncharacterized protein n=1 Tax=Streptomyces gelaticus TaxID=285446 RepID=A0ABQ2W8W0_9ACTN|nr:hypothetical protein GCM10015535_64600 [Streptomyces gelaticus]